MQQTNYDDASQIMIVRHGERIDEVKGNQWYDDCKKLHGSKPKIEYSSRVNDPPLTSNGVSMAKECSLTIRDHLIGQKQYVECIYSSKLIRAVQTAYEIALELAVPIVLSKGFAMTAAAVRKMGDNFQFLSMEEIKKLCPLVDLVDGDVNVHGANQEVVETVPSHWSKSIEYLTEKRKFSIMVAHRESIRNLVGDPRISTPYCCFSIFRCNHVMEKLAEGGGDRPSTPPSSRSSGSGTHKLIHHSHRNGVKIKINGEEDIDADDIHEWP